MREARAATERRDGLDDGNASLTERRQNVQLARRPARIEVTIAEQRTEHAPAPIVPRDDAHTRDLEHAHAAAPTRARHRFPVLPQLLDRHISQIFTHDSRAARHAG